MIALIAVLVAVAVLLGGYASWLVERHQRLTARVDGAWAALDAALVRRAAATRALAGARADGSLLGLANAALGDSGGRQDIENDLGRGLRQGGYEPLEVAALPAAQRDHLVELRGAAARVRLARQFHNDAVRDLAALRRRPAARVMRLGHAVPRAYFEIDDTVMAPPAVG